MKMTKIDKLNEKQITKMRWVLFCVFASIFVIIVIGTLLVVFFGIGKPTGKERDLLFNVFIVEVGIAVIALFKMLFNLKKKPQEGKQEEKPILEVGGRYEYEIDCGDNILFLGECQIKQEGRRLSFSGERKKKIVGDKEENVSIPWFSQWAEICLDNKIRMDYSLTINGGIRGYSILVLEAGLEAEDIMVGEFHLFEQAHVCGTVRFKKCLSKPKPSLKR
jgi:hypothetical protein